MRPHRLHHVRGEEVETCFWHLGLASNQDVLELSDRHMSSQEKGRSMRLQLKIKSSRNAAFTQHHEVKYSATMQAHDISPALRLQLIQHAGSQNRRKATVVFDKDRRFVLSLLRSDRSLMIRVLTELTFRHEFRCQFPSHKAQNPTEKTEHMSKENKAGEGKG